MPLAARFTPRKCLVVTEAIPACVFRGGLGSHREQAKRGEICDGSRRNYLSDTTEYVFDRGNFMSVAVFVTRRLGLFQPIVFVVITLRARVEFCERSRAWFISISSVQVLGFWTREGSHKRAQPFDVATALLALAG